MSSHRQRSHTTRDGADRAAAALGRVVGALALVAALLPRPAHAQANVQGGRGATGSTFLFELTGGRGGVLLDTIGTITLVERPWPDVHRAAAAALQRFGVPLAIHDTSAGVAGTTGFFVSRRLGRTSLAHYLDCGSGIAGPNANFARARLAVLVFARRQDATSTALRTAVVATARTLDGASQHELTCATTGRLEEQLTAAVEAELARTP